jgi:hypothetical protein
MTPRCVPVSLSLSLSLPLSLPLSPLYLSLTHSLSLALALSLSRSLTHTHFLFLTLSLSTYLLLFLPLSPDPMTLQSKPSLSLLRAERDLAQRAGLSISLPPTLPQISFFSLPSLILPGPHHLMCVLVQAHTYASYEAH